MRLFPSLLAGTVLLAACTCQREQRYWRLDPDRQCLVESDVSVCMDLRQGLTGRCSTCGVRDGVVYVSDDYCVEAPGSQPCSAEQEKMLDAPQCPDRDWSGTYPLWATGTEATCASAASTAVWGRWTLTLAQDASHPSQGRARLEGSGLAYFEGRDLDVTLDSHLLVFREGDWPSPSCPPETSVRVVLSLGSSGSLELQEAGLKDCGGPASDPANVCEHALKVLLDPVGCEQVARFSRYERSKACLEPSFVGVCLEGTPPPCARCSLSRFGDLYVTPDCLTLPEAAPCSPEDEVLMSSAPVCAPF